jgi:hypothetical protein
MKIIRRFNIAGIWKQDFLSDEDILKVRDVLRGDNVEIMKLCISDARNLMSKEIAETNGETMMTMTAIALGLFDKLADMAFTRFQGELDERELLARDNKPAQEVTPEMKKTDESYKQARKEKDENDVLW